MITLRSFGNLLFITTLSCLTFHALAISFHSWLINTCKTCGKEDPEISWKVSLNYRCYTYPIASLFQSSTTTQLTSIINSTKAEICIPNLYLVAKRKQYAKECLQAAIEYSDNVCAMGYYNKAHCRCEYTVRTRSMSTLTLLIAILLVVLALIAHFISYVSVESILKWLIWAGIVLSIFVIISLLLVVFIGITNNNLDIIELRYNWSLVEQAMQNITEITYWRKRVKAEVKEKFTITYGWCFGMELLSINFAFVTLTIFCVVLHNKKQRNR